MEKLVLPKSCTTYSLVRDHDSMIGQGTGKTVYETSAETMT